MVKKKIVEGSCLSCGNLSSVKLYDLYHGNNKIPYAKDVAICDDCGEDEIEIRKVNNRRFKIIGKW